MTELKLSCIAHDQGHIGRLNIQGGGQLAKQGLRFNCGKVAFKAFFENALTALHFQERKLTES